MMISILNWTIASTSDIDFMVVNDNTCSIYIMEQEDQPNVTISCITCHWYNSIVSLTSIR